MTEDKTYVVENLNNGFIKIGCSCNVKQRIKVLQDATPDILELIGILPVGEKYIHVKFAHARIKGEWYKPHPTLIRYLAIYGINWKRENPAPRQIHKKQSPMSIKSSPWFEFAF
jgi:hypothetical protein